MSGKFKPEPALHQVGPVVPDATVNSYNLSFIGLSLNTIRKTFPGDTTNVDEDISQFAVDNNFQADFATGDINHTLLIGLDHQRSNTNYTSIFGGARPSTSTTRSRLADHSPVHQRFLGFMTTMTQRDLPDRSVRPGSNGPRPMAPDPQRS